MPHEVAIPALTTWESFYVIVGSSSAALVGLQFVVIAIIADRPLKDTVTGVDTFSTPTIVHFGMVLLISSVMSAPWPGIRSLAFALGTCGAGGLIYLAVVVSRMRRVAAYEPVFEDWLWYSILPPAAYVAFLSAAAAIARETTAALFVVAAATLLLLFVGIHNAWDTVTYVALYHRRDGDSNPEP